MSGHSKFSNIRAKKEKNDAAKGKIFTMIGHELALAVKAGGPDPANNSKLAAVIAKAKANNMPNDTINSGIKKAAGSMDADNFEELQYEGYGPNGVAIIVKVLTDNKNRAAADVRSAFTKGHGSLATQGAVSFMFDEKGQIILDREAMDDMGKDFDTLMDMAIEAGAEDITDEEDSYVIITDPADFETVREAGHPDGRSGRRDDPAELRIGYRSRGRKGTSQNPRSARRIRGRSDSIHQLGRRE